MYIQNVPSVFSNYIPLVNYIDELIECGRQNIFSIKDDEKSKILSLIMEALNDDQGYVIFDNDDFSNNCENFKNFLKNDSMHDVAKFIQSLKNSSFKRYSDMLQEIFYHVSSMRYAA